MLLFIAVAILGWNYFFKCMKRDAQKIEDNAYEIGLLKERQ